MLSGENHPNYGKSRSSETKEAISKALIARFKITSHHNLGKKGELAPQYGIGGSPVYIYDATSFELILSFPSTNSAANFLHISWSTLKKYLRRYRTKDDYVLLRKIVAIPLKKNISGLLLLAIRRLLSLMASKKPWVNTPD